ASCSALERMLEISNEEWDAIELVTKWLKHFRDATTQMSSTKQPMLSQTHAIFRGLQEHLRTALRELPNNAPPRIRDGLVAAHEKLADYYSKYDLSPYYLWAA
ncbi:hypothetical protein H0H81_010363, partial [Sphagnurus paluster]